MTGGRAADTSGRAGLRARNESRGTTMAERLEVAGGLWGRFMGLMGRARLRPGDGLWLAGTNGIHMLFMRFPIDAVFLSRPDATGRRRVLAARADLPPWRGLVPFVRGADGVLELPAGTIAGTATAPGDEVRLEEASA